jgi:hypothetical protein
MESTKTVRLSALINKLRKRKFMQINSILLDACFLLLVWNTVILSAAGLTEARASA